MPTKKTLLFIVCFGLVCVLGGLTAKAATPEYLSQPDYADYMAAVRGYEQDQQPVLLLIGADWCGPCQALKPRHPQLATHGHFVDLNVDRHAPLLKALRVPLKTIPRLVIWSHGAWRILVGPAEIRAYAEGRLR